jgi:hypothetical protein
MNVGAQRFNFEDAKQFMSIGLIMSADGGDYDYYKMYGDQLMGFYSCDDEKYPLDVTEDIKNSEWYLIS